MKKGKLIWFLGFVLVMIYACGIIDIDMSTGNGLGFGTGTGTGTGTDNGDTGGGADATPIPLSGTDGEETNVKGDSGTPVSDIDPNGDYEAELVLANGRAFAYHRIEGALAATPTDNSPCIIYIMKDIVFPYTRTGLETRSGQNFTLTCWQDSDKKLYRSQTGATPLLKNVAGANLTISGGGGYGITFSGGGYSSGYYGDLLHNNGEAYLNSGATFRDSGDADLNLEAIAIAVKTPGNLILNGATITNNHYFALRVFDGINQVGGQVLILSGSIRNNQGIPLYIEDDGSCIMRGGSINNNDGLGSANTSGVYVAQ
jgi:hypothetical protein